MSLLPPLIDTAIRKSLKELYNLEFEEANLSINQVKEEENNHPLIAFTSASIQWWKLSTLALETNKDEGEKFEALAKSCIRVCEKKISRGDSTGEAELVLGGIWGLYGRWQIANGRWLPAYFSGKKAAKYLNASLEKNPLLTDAYMGLGMFNYYVATLPGVVRALAFLGASGDKHKGLDQLEKAAMSPMYASVPTRIFLHDIYLYGEKDPDRAYDIITKLASESANSPYIRMQEITNLYNTGRTEELIMKADSFMKDILTGVLSEKAKPEGFFSKGISLFKEKKWDAALVYFNDAIKLSPSENPYGTWSTLYKGLTLEAIGNKPEAQKIFRELLKMPNRWSSHENARKFLKDPFVGRDNQIEKLWL
ncbi:MAG: tetratricopeptide repeat protein [Elusimicrobiota bacterium]